MFEWPEVFTQFISFLFSFFAIGAVGYRIFVLHGANEPQLAGRASRRAATIGLIGAVGSLLMYIAMDMPQAAARQHTSVGHAMFANPATATGTICVFALVVAFGLALSRVEAAWIIALLATFISPLAPLLGGLSKWTRIINPLHRLAGGFWIGTLFVMLVAGLTVRVVDAFTPLALTSFGALGASGLVTAWRHLKRLDALWTTPYGYALIAKLCVVAIVVGLGAMNWRRHSHEQLQRSATAEVVAATIVLMITAVLVSLPSPK